MAERAAERGEGDSGIAAGRLHDGIAGLQIPALGRLSQDVEGHAVLDAPGHVQLLALGVDDTAPPAITQLRSQHRGIADQPAEAPQPGARRLVQNGQRHNEMGG